MRSQVNAYLQPMTIFNGGQHVGWLLACPHHQRNLKESQLPKPFYGNWSPIFFSSFWKVISNVCINVAFLPLTDFHSRKSNSNLCYATACNFTCIWVTPMAGMLGKNGPTQIPGWSSDPCFIGGSSSMASTTLFIQGHGHPGRDGPHKAREKQK